MLQFLFALLVAFRVFLRTRADTALEVLALRQQVAALKLIRLGKVPPGLKANELERYLRAHGAEWRSSPDTSTATPVVAGLSTNNVQLAVTFTSGAPSAMTVSITNFQVQAYAGKVTLNGKPYVWFPFTGYWAPP